MSTPQGNDSPTPFPLSTPWPRRPSDLGGGGGGGGDFPWPWSRVVESFGQDGGGSHPWPWKQLFAAMAGDLIGRKLHLSKDNANPRVEPGTVHIVVDEDGRIRNFWIDPDLPTS